MQFLVFLILTTFMLAISLVFLTCVPPQGHPIFPPTQTTLRGPSLSKLETNVPGKQFSNSWFSVLQ